MFHTSQCVMSIFELFAGNDGSGSFMISTKLCVPGGTCVQLSAGFGAVGPAACVYLSGITPPSSHAVDVMINGGVCGPRPAPRPWPPPAGGPCARSARLIAAVSVAVTRTFALMRSPFFHWRRAQPPPRTYAEPLACARGWPQALSNLLTSYFSLLTSFTALQDSSTV